MGPRLSKVSNIGPNTMTIGYIALFTTRFDHVFGLSTSDKVYFTLVFHFSFISVVGSTGLAQNHLEGYFTNQQNLLASYFHRPHRLDVEVACATTYTKIPWDVFETSFAGDKVHTNTRSIQLIEFTQVMNF
jgi:hypothetical protein